MRDFSKQSSGSESEPENGRRRRFPRLLAITVLGTMQLLLISLVTRSQAQESVLDSSDVLDGLLAFLPLYRTPNVLALQGRVYQFLILLELPVSTSIL